VLAPLILTLFTICFAHHHVAPAIPILFLVPICEHFAAVGKGLSNYGFEVLICELSSSHSLTYGVSGPQASSLVTDIVKTLGWGGKGVIVVGCGTESIASIDAARGSGVVRGVVVCGNLGKVAERMREEVVGDGKRGERGSEEVAMIR